MSITPIPSRRYVQKVLPTSYDDSLTYLEELGQLQYKVNECISAIDEVLEQWETISTDFESLRTLVNQLQADFDEFEVQIKAYVDTYVAETKEELEGIISTFEDDVTEQIRVFTENTNTAISEFKSDVNSDLVDIRNTLQSFNSSLRQYVDNKVEILELKHNQDITALTNRIDTLVLEYPDILNPTNGLYEDINTVIEDIYSLARTEGITCTEFDDLVITCNTFDDMEITANNFDVKGKTILTE